MASRRMISRNISTSRKVNRLSDRAALLYTWMIPHTDDFGHLEGDPLSIKAKVAPMRSITEQEIAKDIEIMEQSCLIKQYEVKGEKYIEIIGFEDFQTFRSDRPRVALYPNQDGSKIKVNQRDTNDIPMGDIGHGKSKRRISKEEDKSTDPTHAFKYLRNVPKEDIEEFRGRFVATEKDIRSKGEDLALYCERKGRTYKNYKSLLLNALKRDFKEKDPRGEFVPGVGWKK